MRSALGASARVRRAEKTPKHPLVCVHSWVIAEPDVTQGTTEFKSF